MDNAERITRIASRAAKGRGVSASVYTSGKSFDVLTIGREGHVFWIRSAMRDVWLAPSETARRIRYEIRKAWA